LQLQAKHVNVWFRSNESRPSEIESINLIKSKKKTSWDEKERKKSKLKALLPNESNRRHKHEQKRERSFKIELKINISLLDYYINNNDLITNTNMQQLDKRASVIYKGERAKNTYMYNICLIILLLNSHNTQYTYKFICIVLHIFFILLISHINLCILYLIN
jgi:hypothetical protein